VDVKYDPLGKLLAVSCLDSSVRVYNTEEGALFSQIHGQPMENFKLAFQDRNLITGGERGKVSLYDIETQEVVDQYKADEAFILSLDTSANGKYLALGNSLGHVFTIDMESKAI
jgi:WD40 repeat protein